MEECVIIVIDDIEFINHLPYTREAWRKPISGVKRKDALTMDDVTRTSAEGTQTGTDGAQGERTFTQEEVNRIVQERLAKEKSKGTGNTGDELDRRAAALDLRERKLTAREKLREKGLPEYLVDALNMETDETFQKSMEAVMKMKGEEGGSPGAKPVGKMGLIGKVISGNGDIDPLRDAFGLKQVR